MKAHSQGMTDCVNCGAGLQGRQARFCSRECKNSTGNLRLQTCEAPQRRGRERKICLVRRFGSQCQRCGYSRIFAALEFHHRDPGLKAFSLDLRLLSNRRWSAIVIEAEKCDLVCSNCHKEVHYGDCLVPGNGS